MRRNLALTLFVLVLIGAYTQPAKTSLGVAPDATSKGPYAVLAGEYKLPPKIDSDVLADAETELWGKVFWPKEWASAKSPLIVFLHGNHSTCGEYDNRGVRSDYDCTYTSTGQCPSGQVVVPNHEGYNYIAEHLASHGYVVVSVNANRGITCGDGPDDDSGLNLARGRLVLRHLQNWFVWSHDGDAPTSIGAGANGFIDHLDFARVGLMGHSRGGEGMRAAYNLYLDKESVWTKRIPGLNVRAIFEIGAVDGQTSRTLDADNVAWNQLLPMCDGDVDTLEGRLPFERMILKTEEARATPKSLLMVWGANHNFFNTQWMKSDSNDCPHKAIFDPEKAGSAEQMQIAQQTVSAFYFAHLGGQGEFVHNNNPLYSVANSVVTITRLDRDYINSYDQATSRRIDDFDSSEGLSASKVPSLASGVQVHVEGGSPTYAAIEWKRDETNAPGFFQTNLSAVGRGSDWSEWATVDFRIARDDRESGNPEATEFSVALADSRDRLWALLNVSEYADVRGPGHSQAKFQTLRVPIKDFKDINLTNVRGVRFVFDRTKKGKLLFANVRLSQSFDPKLRMDRRLSTSPSLRKQTRQFVAADFSAGHGIEISFAGAHSLDAGNYELVFENPHGFPIGDALTALVLNGQPIYSVRKLDSRLRRLAFRLSREQYRRWQQDAPIFIQYGQGPQARVFHVRASTK